MVRSIGHSSYELNFILIAGFSNLFKNTKSCEMTWGVEPCDLVLPRDQSKMVTKERHFSYKINFFREVSSKIGVTLDCTASVRNLSTHAGWSRGVV
jgi:hypothetical protein